MPRPPRRAPPARKAPTNRRSLHSARPFRRSAERSARLVVSVCAIMRATSVEPVKATPAQRGSATSSTDPSAAGQESQRIGRHAGGMQEAHGQRSNQRRLLGPAWRPPLSAANAAVIWPTKMASGKSALMHTKTGYCVRLSVREEQSVRRTSRAPGPRNSGRNRWPALETASPWVRPPAHDQIARCIMSAARPLQRRWCPTSRAVAARTIASAASWYNIADHAAPIGRRAHLVARCRSNQLPL